MKSNPTLPTVAILLCTHNGERFLDAQLASIAAQTHKQWTVWVSDDGSTDSTRSILEKWQAEWGADRLQVLDGPRAGSSANFLGLVCNPLITAEMFAYCDQDDVWHPDKLDRATKALSSLGQSDAALYLSRSRLIDAENRILGDSRLFKRSPSFPNALVQNIGGGNTMVFNRSARELIAAAGPHVSVVVHDWWTYMVVSGCGGRVISDPTPSLDYRQHSDNQIGSNLGFAAKAWRAGQLLEGRFRLWTDVNLAALATIEHRLTLENQSVLRTFRVARGAGLIGRLLGLRRSGIYRQSFVDNVGLFLAAALNRL
jgi:glycosyltransferase involved in cell wall biosynthesis